MTSKSITIKMVLALEPGQTIWDGGHNEAVKGFGVRRQRETPVYVLKYRAFGRQRFVTIGRHGAPWTPDTARREAKRLLGLVAAGDDPQQGKATAWEKGALLLGAVAEQYLEYAHKKQKARSFVETKRHLMVNWKPLHSTSVYDIQRRHVAARLKQIEKERGETAAGRARAALSAMFNWAIREGFDLAVNPVAGTNRPPEPASRDRVLSDAEIRLIMAVTGQDDYGRIVKLLALTGQRREEVGGMRWSEIDLDRKVWTIPALRTKNRREHLLPLSAAACQILVGVPRVEGRDQVFGRGPRSAGNAPRGFSGWSKGKAELDQTIATALASRSHTLVPWRLHDLRRTCATVMAESLGTPPYIVEAVLNHISGHKAGVAGVYNRATYQMEMRQALDGWAEHLVGIRLEKAA